MTTARRPRNDPAHDWLAAQLRWEQALARLRRRHGAGDDRRADQREDRPAA